MEVGGLAILHPRPWFWAAGQVLSSSLIPRRPAQGAAALSMAFTELLEQAGGAGLFQALQILTFFLF